MAKNQVVWGIDVGNTSLKALRCSLAGVPGKIEALACDFIEHSKVLSLPGTDAAEVLAETLQTFFSRNAVRGDRIAISVSGQNTISRFLPLPPVDPKKIPDVIRYEAKQWLPFDINDVVFDFQPLGKPHQDADNTALVDATVGMFAIKRDVASKALAPYFDQSVDIDSIQSSPIALYNFAAFDQLPPPPAEPVDDAPQESLITLCIGTDATDVVITNGETIWIRNIPLGGNSFTKALTRELQLTFSKAEYLKRNITVSKDVDEQKRVITAMRPVFNDMVNEVNRSLEYYQTLNRKAKFQKIIALGNAAKLPGLRQFIAQNLGYEVVRLNQFNNLTGTEVIETQLFKDNMHSFAVAYGLAVQQLGISSLKTNLIPREVLFDRIIREKKPWMLAAAAALLLGITVQFAGVSSAYNTVVNDAYKKAGERAKSAQTFSSNLKSQRTKALDAFNNVDSIGKNLTSNVEGRITWLELLRAVNAALPQSQPGANVPDAEQIVPPQAQPAPPAESNTADGEGESQPDPDAAGSTDGTQPAPNVAPVTAPPRPGPRQPMTTDSFAKLDRVYIESIEAIAVDSLSTWFEPFKADQRYYPDDRELEELQNNTSTSSSGMTTSTTSSTSMSPASASTTSAASATASTATANENAENGEEGEETEKTPARMTGEERYALVTGPSGGSSGGSTGGTTGGSAGTASAKVVQLVGHHYHNSRDRNEFAEDGGEAYLQKTLLYNLKFGEVELPPTIEEQLAGIPSKKVSMKDLGISFPVLLYVPSVIEYKIVNPNLLDPRTGELPAGIFVDPMLAMDLGPPASTGGTGGMPGGRGTTSRPTTMGSPSGGGTMGTTPLSAYARSRGEREPVITVRRFDFVIQFAWEETPPSQRKLKEESASADTGTNTTGTGAGTGTGTAGNTR